MMRASWKGIGHPMSEWISVNDKLPERLDEGSYESVRVLIYTICGVYTAQYIYPGKYWVSSANKLWIKTPFCIGDRGNPLDWFYPPEFFDDSMKVTHWMPLPEPPKED